MSRLNDLICASCPKGVPFRKLGDIGAFYGGLTGKSKEDFIDGNAVFITYMNVYSNIELKTDVEDRVRIGENEKQNTVQYGDILFTGSSETPDECGISSVMTVHTDKKLYLNSFCFGYRFSDPNMFLPGFTKYLFRSNNLRKQIVRTASGVTRFNVSKKKMGDVTIPVPPLEVQSEIVRVLDNLSEIIDGLNTELTQELSARKSQFDYYRDSLLDFASSIPRVKLEDIAIDIYRGSGVKRDQVTEEGIPCVRYGEIYTKYNTWFDECDSHTQLEYVPNPKYFSHGDVLFAITGESVEDIAKSVAYLGHEQCIAGGDIVVLKHQQNPRYLAHVLSTTMVREQKSKGKIKSKVVHSNVPSIKGIEIPLPPMDIQEKCADLLDSYEKLCKDLTVNLPEEIEARQMQYEYYRNKLLTFTEEQ